MPWRMTGQWFTWSGIAVLPFGSFTMCVLIKAAPLRPLCYAERIEISA
jgi:hypothetical protein